MYINNSTKNNICKVFKYYLLVKLYLTYLTHWNNSSAHLLAPLIFHRGEWELNYVGHKMATELLLGLRDTLLQAFMTVC